LVAAELARHGGHVIAGDPLGHEALRQAEIRERVVRRWGGDLLDERGEVDRRRLGRKVFADAAELRELERIVFPFIERRIREEIAAAREAENVRFVVLDAAVMLEAGWNETCDWLVFVDVPRAARLQRLARSRGWTEGELAAREARQMPLDEKARRADFILDNGGTPAETARQVTSLLDRLELNP
jgi:dephospho-CoA kinase